MPKKTLLIITQTYVPDPAAVGQYMHEAAKELVRRDLDVLVLTANRGYDDTSIRYPYRQTIDGVRIIRLPFSSLGKRSMAVRMLAGMIFVTQCVVVSLLQRRISTILVSTAPPMSSMAALVIAKLRGADIKYWVMDLNMEQLISIGKLRANSPPARLWRWLNDKLLRRASAIVALDRFMASHIQAALSRGSATSSDDATTYPAATAMAPATGGAGTEAEEPLDPRLHVIPPWPLDEHLKPVPRAANPFRAEHGLNDKLVFLYSGNLGIGHPIAAILEAAHRLRDELPEAMFVFIGGGVRKAEVEAAISQQRAAAPNRRPNIMSLPYQPLARLAYSLSAGDIHMVTMDAAGVGCFHPCKVYGSMAVARPVLFAGPNPSHVTDMLTMSPFGWAVPQGDVEATVAIVRQIAASPGDELARMGVNGQQIVANDLSKVRLCGKLCDLLVQ